MKTLEKILETGNNVMNHFFQNIGKYTLAGLLLFTAYCKNQDRVNRFVDELVHPNRPIVYVDGLRNHHKHIKEQGRTEEHIPICEGRYIICRAADDDAELESIGLYSEDNLLYQQKLSGKKTGVLLQVPVSGGKDDEGWYKVMVKDSEGNSFSETFYLENRGSGFKVLSTGESLAIEKHIDSVIKSEPSGYKWHDGTEKSSELLRKLREENFHKYTRARGGI
ncbi:hypothetical protein JW707_01655 [Candidatus Woesearchaeota archaeon]|nr:hypothetical protein [Candidatus Woesearchaeota archaeon]